MYVTDARLNLLQHLIALSMILCHVSSIHPRSVLYNALNPFLGCLFGFVYKPGNNRLSLSTRKIELLTIEASSSVLLCSWTEHVFSQRHMSWCANLLRNFCRTDRPRVQVQQTHCYMCTISFIYMLGLLGISVSCLNSTVWSLSVIVRFLLLPE